MRTSDIVLLLGLAAQFDGRIEVSELKAEAWGLSLSTHIPYEFARNIISKHYGESGDVIAPHHINNQWRMFNKNQTEKYKSVNAMRELESALEVKATPQQISSYVEQIRSTLVNKKRVNENEDNQFTD